MFNLSRCPCLDTEQTRMETGTTIGRTTETQVPSEKQASTTQITRQRSFKCSKQRVKSNCSDEPVIVVFID